MQRDIETIDAELQLMATLRRAAQERGGPLPSIDVADALLDRHIDAAPVWGVLSACPSHDIPKTAPRNTCKGMN